jgi:hypothetical protein
MKFLLCKHFKGKNNKDVIFAQGSACAPFFAIFNNAGFFSCQNKIFDTHF